jgi:glycosyltransferase involved in cell wall biosynthesis
VEALRNEFDFELFAVRGLGDGDVGHTLAEDVRKLGLPLHIGARVPMRFGGVISSGIGMARMVKRVKPDLIHLHTEIPETGYAAMAACLPGTRAAPVVRTIHNTVFWEFWRPLGRWADRQMPRSFVAGVSPGATEAFLRLRKESGGAALPQSPITIYNGVPEPKTVLKREKEAGAKPIQIVFGGRFEFQKGTDLLPQILAQVRPPDPAGARLVLFGSGAHEPQLRALANRPPPGWTIEVRRPIADFASQLGEYDLVIMPSRYEGLGLVAIEAFFAGTPVIATDAEGLREALPPAYPWQAQAGDATSFASLLQSVLTQPESWTNVAEAGRTFARARFTVNAMADAYRSLYRQALADRNG